MLPQGDDQELIVTFVSGGVSLDYLLLLTDPTTQAPPPQQPLPPPPSWQPLRLQ